MLAVKGYFDGTVIKLLENFEAKPNQKVIITIMDEFIDNDDNGKRNKTLKNLRGILARYADPELRAKEKGAWEQAAAEKYIEQTREYEKEYLNV